MHKILQIEQSEFFVKLMKEKIEEKGDELISTDSFNAALSILREEDVDLIITSYYAKGGEIENFVKDAYYIKKLPIFLITSNKVNNESKSLINLGIKEYILKESLEDDILEKIDKLFRETKYEAILKEAKVAVVDDNGLERVNQRDRLESFGIKNIDVYKSGEDLLNSGKSYDVYLVDIILKNEYGIDIISKIRTTNLDTVIIAVTGLDGDQAIANVLNAGADDVILKTNSKELYMAKLLTNIRIHYYKNMLTEK